MRAVTDDDAKAAAVAEHQARAERVEVWGKACASLAVAALLVETVALEALAITVCIKAIHHGNR